MAVEIILPRVDMEMETGKFTRWFAAEGDSVAKGAPLFEIETAKAAMEIEAPASGILRGVNASPGDEFPVGAVLGWIHATGEAYVAPTPAPAVKAKFVDVAPIAETAQSPGVAADGRRATPKARRLAREQGARIADIAGSGPSGRVQARDVEAHSSAPAATLHREWLARGDGAPIVFVHGFGADLNGWRPLMKHLAPGRGALGVDLPGHGRSRSRGEATLEALADALAAMLAAERLPAAHLVGHSLGAAVAALHAARAGSAVRSLTLLSPTGLGPEINGDFLRGFLAARSEASLAPWIRQLAVDEAALGSAMVKTTLRQRLELQLGEAQARLAEALFPDGAQAFDIRARLSSYAGPIKVVFGLADAIIPARHARGFSGAVALHLFAGVGHMPHFEARVAVARLVADNVAAGDARACGRDR